MKRARIIYNPTAGRETFIKDLPMVLEQLETSGYEASAHATTGDGDAMAAAKIAVERKYDLVIVAGGDGTINEVVNGIAEADYRPKLGIIPAGTTNDFARALDIPRDVKKAISIILDDNNVHLLDIGKINEQYFVNIAGGGELTELTYDVPSKLKAAIGQLAYVFKGIEMLPFIKPVSTVIEYDDNVFEGEIMLFLVANTNSVGGFEKLAPDARTDDGYFDLIILKKANLAETVRVITSGLRGGHIDDKLVIYAQAKQIKITPKEQMQLNLDGEFGGLLPGEITNLKQHIQFYLPKSYVEIEETVQLEESETIETVELLKND